MCMWVCGQSKIVIGLYILDGTYWTCGQCCVFRMCMVESNILTGLYVLDMWSVLFVMYDVGMF